MSAVSVVLSGHTCRSCTASTPSRAASAVSTSSRSIPEGTPANDIHTDSLSSPMLPHRITTATTRLIAGSTHCWPVHRITSPAKTTATETAASDAICRNAPRILMSCWPRTNIIALIPFTMIPSAATAMIVCPCAAEGWISRRTTSAPIAPTAINRNSAFASAARMEAFLSP